MASELDSNRGQIGGTTTLIVSVMVALFVTIIVSATLAPVAIDALEEPSETTITQDNGTTVEVTAGLNSTVDTVTSTDVTVTLQTNDGESTQKTISEGNNATFSFNDGDVTVTADSVDNANDQATLTYEYPTDFDWSGGASGLWNILGLIGVLGVFLILLSLVLGATNRV